MGVHNLPLESFLSGGVVGCLLFSGFWAVVLVRLLRWTRRMPGNEAWALLVSLLLTSAIGVIVSIRFENLGTLVFGTLVWWLASGPYPIGSPLARMPPNRPPASAP